MADITYEVPDNPAYDPKIRQIEDSDPVLASGIVNPVLSKIITNTQAAKRLAWAGGKQTCRYIVGTSAAGWTADDVDYLCDGTDDQIEIAAAINALPEEGGEVVLLDGVYNMTAQTAIQQKNNVTLRGCGNGTILKRMWGGLGEWILSFASTTGFRVMDLTFDGNKANLQGEAHCNLVFGSRCTHCSAIRIFSKDVKGTGIRVNGINVEALTVKDCICTNYDSFGIQVSMNTSVSGCVCTSTASNSVGIYVVKGSNKITGNYCSGGDGGIQLDAYGNTVTGNFVEDCYYGIFSASNSAAGSLITGNTCLNCPYAGIGIAGSGNLVSGNFCKKGAGDAKTILLDSSVGGNLVTFNYLNGSDVQDNSGVTTNTIADNKVR